MQINLQDAFLAQLKKEGNVVAVFLSKGVQLKGVIRGFDNFTIFLEDHEGRLQMVYKHSVTTVSPTRETSDAFLKEAFKDTDKKNPVAR
ncbi:MAG: RNA chaperone Hfq [Armatimonadetes bacterium]|nr:RNA chaperone Hfq [Armatimonadota bacterium]